MKGSYDLELVAASYCVAVIAAFSAIYFGTRVRTLSGGSKSFWFCAGAFCLGAGIWSMHFVGMSAYKMPMAMEMSFDLSITVTSLILAVLASALGLRAITRTSVNAVQLLAHAMIMGMGVFAMHYCGMYAMQMDPPIQYDTLLVAVSGVIAVAASGAAMVICRNIERVPRRYGILVKAAAALVMGLAVCGMHYTGMAAVSFPMDATMPMSNTLRGNWMGTPTAVAASFFLLLLVYIAFEDFRELERARQAEKQAAEAVTHAAFNDTHTGLPNRTALESHLKELTGASTAARKEPFSLLYFELQDYRRISSESGEKAAQGYASNFASVLRQQFPAPAYLSRYNTNGFIAVLPLRDSGTLESLAGQLAESLAHPLGRGTQPTPYQFGIGYASYPAAGVVSRPLIRLAQVIRARFESRHTPQVLKTAATPA
ncbi:MHYT domain-containing protein [Pseudomaricurvus sp. HS19]|uniref:MHYT domain-containing protein n=1 Tax=Pseudomaricurvus sp. HS19 TaxID=2692626 RepID=UPI001369A9D0|nr:MHYT domain-containing protein [Pseudomaricurvus sp. HS19]MYM62427.1 diguanylate cyclase [Pseudomaricurvus sp. HS19]